LRNQFRGYYRPTDQEFANMWHNGTFVLDANVLLNLYRYSAMTRRELLDILSRISLQLWLPNQAAKEFHANRIGVISEQLQEYGRPEKVLNETYNKLQEMFQSQKHPFIENSEGVLKELAESFEGIKAKLSSSFETQMSFVKDNLGYDELKERITELFDERVGLPYGWEKLETLYKEAAQRYDKKIPPGYEDKKKDGDKKYGDYILWTQIIDFAKESNKPILLITSDRKIDWWLKSEGQTIGPHPQLINEVWEKAGTSFYMYDTEQFMEFSRKYLKAQVEQRAIDEIRDMVQIKAMSGENDYLILNDLIKNQDFSILKENMDRLLEKLTGREERVLRLRFGLDDGQPRSRVEIGTKFGVSASTIGRLERSALRKLRNWENLETSDGENPDISE